ncbi:hypothetical protein VTH82DRAFT_2801 [Thermothelomyces myriococcoides]
MEIYCKDRKQKIPTSRAQLEKEWKKQWQTFSIKQLQRYVERIQGNIKWVIQLARGNEYKEGTVPEPLPPGEEEPGYRVWREWVQKSATEKEAELQAELEAEAATVDEDGLSIGDIVYLIRG